MGLERHTSMYGTFPKYGPESLIGKFKILIHCIGNKLTPIINHLKEGHVRRPPNTNPTRPPINIKIKEKNGITQRFSSGE